MPRDALKCQRETGCRNGKTLTPGTKWAAGRSRRKKAMRTITDVVSEELENGNTEIIEYNKKVALREGSLYALAALFWEILSRHPGLAGCLTEKELARLDELKASYASSSTLVADEEWGDPLAVFTNPTPLVCKDSASDALAAIQMTVSRLL
jgi:hypothetical protein